MLLLSSVDLTFVVEMTRRCRKRKIHSLKILIIKCCYIIRDAENLLTLVALGAIQQQSARKLFNEIENKENHIFFSSFRGYTLVCWLRGLVNI